MRLQFLASAGKPSVHPLPVADPSLHVDLCLTRTRANAKHTHKVNVRSPCLQATVSRGTALASKI
jgi:hypothetical protein